MGKQLIQYINAMGFSLPGLPPEFLVDSYSESNADAFFTIATGNSLFGVGQAFTAIAGNISSSQFWAKKDGTPTGTVFSKLYNLSGTFGTNAIPSGAALATSDGIDISTISTTLSLVTFTFSNTFTLVNGTNYGISLEYAGDGSANGINYGQDSSSPTHAGNLFFNNGSWNASSTADLCFYVYAR